MRIIRILFIISLIVFQINSFAQEQEDIKFCKTSEVNEQLLNENPELRLEREYFNNLIKEYVRNNPKDDNTYIIPVVFHVIHNYGPENISKAQIEDQIRILNDDYNLMNSDTTMIIDEFKNLAANCNIEFRLAKLDPNGNCTDGITRTVSELTYNGGEEVKQISPTWNRENLSYLNVWVVNRIEGAAGYSYYPYYDDMSYAGILMTYSYVGSIEEGSVNRSRTLTHEIGHYLNLAHPWGSTNEPGSPANCGIDDDVDDTPNTIGHTTCSLYAVTCGSLDNVQNYMDYSYCARMFTIGQAARMHAALNSYPTRIMLWQTDNLANTGVLDPNAIAECTPICDFANELVFGCTNLEVQLSDLSYNTDVIDNWEWELEGAIPSVSYEKNPIVNYPEPGKYNVSLTVSNDAGYDSKTVSNKVIIYDPNDALDLPASLDIENNDFPIVQGSEFNEYFFIENSESSWERTSNAASSGDYSMRILNGYNIENTSNSFLTPAFKFDSLDFPINIYFDVAYSKKSSSTNDILKVHFSDDCGQTWKLQYYKSGNILATTDYNTPYGTFVPTADEWREESISLSQIFFYHSNSVKIKFESISKGGNTMYVDNIRIERDLTNISTSKNIEAKLYPNPFTDILYLETEGTENLEIYISDISGRILAQKIINKGETLVEISNLLPKGISGFFIIKIVGEDSQEVFKLQKM